MRRISDRRVDDHGSVLLVIGDNVDRADMADLLAAMGFDVAACGDAIVALDLARNAGRSRSEQRGIDFALLDYATMTGQAADVILALRDDMPGVRIVVLSRIASLAGAVACIKAGAANFLTLPISDGEVGRLFRDGYDLDCPTDILTVSEAIRQHAAATLRGVDHNLAAAARLLRTDYRRVRRLAGGRAGSGRARSDADSNDPRANQSSAAPGNENGRSSASASGERRRVRFGSSQGMTDGR